MRKLLSSLAFLFIAIIAVQAQNELPAPFSIMEDSVHDNVKMLKGIIQKNDLTGDTSFIGWYKESQRIYPHPDSAAVAAFRNNKDSIFFLIFGGTWCMDTHFILPKFYKIQETADFPENRVTVFAVDRQMNTTGNLTKALHITHTPTIVVMRNGKEIGRVVEYGKTGYWDKELAEIINQ
jgi:thiol-disulfide isomerase/thioredoxin